MAKLDPSKATETSLDRTDEDGERLPQRCTARKQWQRNAFTNLTGVPRNPKELARELMTGNRRKCISKFPHPKVRRDARQLRVLGSLIATHVGTPRRSRRCGDPVRGNATQLHQTAGTKRGAEDHPMFPSAKRAHAIDPPVPQILSHLHVEMEMMSLPEDAMEAQPDVEMGTQSVRSDTKKASSTWEDCADKINMEVCLNTVGECRRCDTDDVLATVARVGSEPTQMQECEVFKWRRRSKRSSMETVISTRLSHEVKRNKAQPRNVTPECADAMRVSEHHASTPCTRTQRLMINRMMSKCRTRQPESYDTLSAFLHDWLERGVCGQNLRQIPD